MVSSRRTSLCGIPSIRPTTKSLVASLLGELGSVNTMSECGYVSLMTAVGEHASTGTADEYAPPACKNSAKPVCVR